MRIPPWPHFAIWLLLLTLSSSLLSRAAGATPSCTGLPPSTLEVYGITAPQVEEVWVAAEELDRRGQIGDLFSQHTMMLTVSNIVIHFDIDHRMLLREDGSVCDAPSLVRIGLGSTRRLAFLARETATDVCVRQQMLDHEATHTRALNAVVKSFIAQQRSAFQQGMMALKQTPAPNAEVAIARWETGMRAILAEVRQQLLAAMQSANAAIESPEALTALEEACGGKIQQLEHHGTSPL